jgi:hypothetical protein
MSVSNLKEDPMLLPNVNTYSWSVEAGLNKQSDFFIGTLWSSNLSFTKDSFSDLLAMGALPPLVLYDLGNNYETFIRDVYEFEKDIPDIQEYLAEKISVLKEFGNTSIYSFTIKVDSPKYVYDPEVNRFKCEQVGTIKKIFRKKYEPMLPRYHPYALIHISDMDKETAHMAAILEKYRHFIKQDKMSRGRC